MRIGDIIVNPYVKKDFDTRPNPMYKSMVIHIGKEYTTCLRYDGKQTKYYTKDCENWEVAHSVKLYEIVLYGKETIDEIFV